MSKEEIKFREYLLILSSEFPTHRKTEAMEELLKIYNKQEKEINKLKEQNKKLKELLQKKNNYTHQLEKDLFEGCSNYVIKKDEIREKIKELKEKGNYRDIYNPTGRVHFMKEETDYQIQVLYELLGE